MPYPPPFYPYTIEYRPRQRSCNAPFFSGAAVFSHYNTIPRQCSPLLPISRNDSLSSWNFIDKIKSMCPWRDNDISTSAKTVLCTPLYLPSPSEFFHPRPAPLPPSTVDRLPYDTSYSHLPFGQNITNRPHAFDILPPVRGRKELFAGEQQASKVSIARHSKRSRPPLSPRHNVHQTRHREEGARKRVRFSSEFLPSDTSGPNVYRVLTILDEKLVAEKITSIFEEYFPKGNSVDGLEAPTATFLALWYLGRLFRRGIFSLSDVDTVGAPEAVIRVFLLGLTLADKWLNDSSRRLKDWSKFCRLPLHYRTSAEKRALRMLDYNISITNMEWRDWLDRLEPSTSKFVSANLTHSTQITAKVALDNLRRAKELESATIKGPARPREVEISSESLYFLRLDLLEDK
ncbi:hypothetical protein C0989_001836 [Termitomyces sp. Mn162]|nr:hypothetical protein C0989_001836 [Termitomyces sp. Mn162]